MWWTGHKTITDLSVQHFGSILTSITDFNGLYIYDNNDALIHNEVEYNSLNLHELQS